MAPKLSTLVTSGMFGSKQKTSLPLVRAINSNPKLVCVDLGGAGDCGFRAAAAAMIDNILLVKSRANQALAKRLLDFHATYFEQQQISIRLITPVDHLAKLLESPYARAKFLGELAFALRQETVNELCAHPEFYRGAFVDENEGTSPTNMRLQSTWIDESAIAALSKITQVPIEVQVVEPNKELQMRLNYNAEIQQPASPIVMQLQGKHYVAQVNRPEYFETINRQKIELSKPKSISQVNDPELEDILARIAMDDQRLLEEYEKNVKWLTEMVKDEKMIKENLIDIYIKGMQNSDYLQGRIKYVGIEHGSQQFFEEIQAAQQGIKPIGLPEECHDDLVILELVHAIARAVSIGQVAPELVYEVGEKTFLSPS
jgi:hypothetical protein